MKKALLILSLIALMTPNALRAQLKGDNILGDLGLQSGTQAPPGFNIIVPVYFYNAQKLKDDHGNVLSGNLDLNMFFTGIGASWVLPQKILGANLGGSVIFPFAANRLQSNLANEKSSFAFSDIYFQPVQLGWHRKQADFLFGYALYFPSGKYQLGGDGNAGLGMLTNEFSAGTTIFFDKKKLYHFSTLGQFEIHSKKKDTEIRPGDILSIEGGLGRTFYKKAKGPIPVIFNAGLVYYMQYKLTEDNIKGNGISIGDAKDHIYGLGVEGNVFVPSIRTQFALRWLGELGAVNRVQGNTFCLTMGYALKSFK